MTEKKKNFEETLKKLEEAAQKLKSDDIPLEEAMKILDKAEQKIETLAK